jgi:hypothetical protein
MATSNHHPADPQVLPASIEACLQLAQSVAGTPGALAPHQLMPEFLDHEGLARQLSCSLTTIHKLRRDGVLGDPYQIGTLVRWHWPTVRERILAKRAAEQTLAADPFIDRLNGAPP